MKQVRVIGYCLAEDIDELRKADSFLHGIEYLEDGKWNLLTSEIEFALNEHKIFRAGGHGQFGESKGLGSKGYFSNDWVDNSLNRVCLTSPNFLDLDICNSHWYSLDYLDKNGNHIFDYRENHAGSRDLIVRMIKRRIDLSSWNFEDIIDMETCMKSSCQKHNGRYNRNYDRLEALFNCCSERIEIDDFYGRKIIHQNHDMVCFYDNGNSPVKNDFDISEDHFKNLYNFIGVSDK